MKLLITQVDNGYILQDFSEPIRTVVIEEEDTITDDGDLKDAEIVRKLLWQVREFFGLYYNKHAKFNCSVTIINAKGGVHQI